MKEYIRMIAVLTIIAALCGLLLAAVNKGTQKRIEMQLLTNVQGPAVKTVLESSTNNVIEDRMDITLEETAHTIFIGKKDNNTWAIAFETSAAGFGGDIGVMVGFNLANDQLTGIGILTHKETPGLGARITETAFTDTFKDKPIASAFKVKKDKGIIDAVSGATISSRGVCSAVEKSITLYPLIKQKILEKNN